MYRLPIWSIFVLLNFISFSQIYNRTGKNIGLSIGASSSVACDQSNFHFGLQSHVSKYLIPEVGYRITKQYSSSRIENLGEYQNFITPGVQIRTRFLSTPGRRVRGICTKEFFDLALTPEFNISLSQPIENVFSLRVGLCIYQMKSGMSKSRRAWSYKVEPYYRHGFSNQGIINKELGFSLKITRFEVYNFLK